MAETTKIQWVRARFGPAPKPPRDGDRKQARQRINVLVRTGRLPRPGSLPCSRCGHRGDDRRHNYHHHNGYAAAHHYDVVVVCTKCHPAADGPPATHCLRGHEYTEVNTIVKKNGTRQCRACRQAYDLRRRDAAWWRAYRLKRKEKSSRG